MLFPLLRMFFHLPLAGFHSPQSQIEVGALPHGLCDSDQDTFSVLSFLSAPSLFLCGTEHHQEGRDCFPPVCCCASLHGLDGCLAMCVTDLVTVSQSSPASERGIAFSCCHLAGPHSLSRSYRRT